MGKLKLVVLMVAVLASTAWSQQLAPKTEITGGYTFGSMDSNGAGRLNSNGWNTGATVYLRHFGIEGNVTGTSYSQSASVTSGGVTISGSASLSNYSFLFGPRFTFGQSRMNPFVHGLFGFDRMKAETTVLGISASATDNAFASALGGGVEYGLSKHLGLTTGADYFMTRHASATQNNIRVSAGLVVRFGSGFENGPKH